MFTKRLSLNLYAILKSPLFTEVLIIITLIFTFNNYIGTSERTIKSDGVGYYDYLPSIFIHGDLNRKDSPEKSNPKLYQRINQIHCYLDYEEHKVNKYPVGTALLQSPFFYFTYLKHGSEGGVKDGYQNYYHKTIYHASLFYLFLSIVFLRMLLIRYKIKRHVIIICQILIVLGTSVTNYVNFDASFSHVYSLFGITAFLYFSKTYFDKKQFKYFFWACLFLGLIVIIRQVNVVIFFFLPFLAGSYNNFKETVLFTLRNKKKLLFGLVLFFLVVFIQLFVWYLQTGHFIVYSYQGEGFNWSKPEIFNILFSYNKGLFLYTPILFICLFGLVEFIIKKKYYLLFTWLGFFLFLTYILSSWWSWQYGSSYGLRAYIDYYAIFFIPFAFLLNNLRFGAKILILALAGLTIPLNFIQTYQYKKYILHWDGMDKEKYWKVFLKTDKKYEGFLWTKELNENQHTLEKEIHLGDINLDKGDSDSIRICFLADLPNLDKKYTIQVLIDHYFYENIEAEISITIPEYYNYKVPYIHFMKEDFDHFQSGLYNFNISDIGPIKIISNKEVILKIFTKDSLDLKNVRVKFYSKK